MQKWKQLEIKWRRRARLRRKLKEKYSQQKASHKCCQQVNTLAHRIILCADRKQHDPFCPHHRARSFYLRMGSCHILQKEIWLQLWLACTNTFHSIDNDGVYAENRDSQRIVRMRAIRFQWDIVNWKCDFVASSIVLCGAADKDDTIMHRCGGLCDDRDRESWCFFLAKKYVSGKIAQQQH